MSPEPNVDDKPSAQQVATMNVDGSTTSAVGLTIDEGQGAKKPDGPSAESLKVTPDQFTKYFKDGKYDWESHAREAEFKIDQKPADQKPADQRPAPDAKGEADAKSLAENAGLNWDSLRDKIVADGDISEADYEALKKIGIPEEIAREHIDAIYEKAAAHYDKIMAMFGDAAGLKATVDKLVADGTYTDADRAVLSEKLSSPREAVITANLLLQQSGQPVKTNVQQQAPMVRGGNQVTPSGNDAKGFATEAEFVAAIRDPRYKKDVAYRAEVTEKAAASQFEQNPRRHTSGL